jgi:hypothetical protein
MKLKLFNLFILYIVTAFRSASTQTNPELAHACRVPAKAMPINGLIYFNTNTLIHESSF